MATEKLIIELDAKVGNLTTELEKINKRLDETDEKTKNADKSLKELSEGVKKVTKFTSGAVAAFTAFVTIAAKSRSELQNLADTANDSIAAFEATAFALQTVGVDASGTAQLLNDVTEAASEFANVGAGPFQDLADQIGLTEAQAKSLALEVKDLSGTDAMLRLVSVVNEAGLSFADTNQALKAISSDFQFLSPLIANNGRELQTLTQRYNEANAALSLTSVQEQSLKELSTTTTLLTDQLGNSANLISATVAPTFNAFFNAVIDVVPEATNTIVDFFNKFQEASNITDINSINREIEELNDSAAKYEEQLNSLISGEYQLAFGNNENIQAQAEGLTVVNERLAELKSRRDELIEQQAILDEVSKRNGGLISGGSRAADEDAQKQLEAIADRFKSEEELLRQKLSEELAIVGENKELRKALEEEFNNELLARETERLNEQLSKEKEASNKIKKLRQDDLKAEQQAQSDKLAYAQTYTGAALTLANTFFEDNKALRAGLVVVDTAAGIAKAFADLPYPAALAASASIAATGAAQLAAITSATKGSGGAGSSVSGTTDVTNDLIDNLGDTSDLTISAGDTSGANQALILKIEADDSDVANSIQALLKNAKLSGTLQ